MFFLLPDKPGAAISAGLTICGTCLRVTLAGNAPSLTATG